MIEEALDWMGFERDSEVDICSDGSAWVGLTQIMPRGSIVLED